MPINISRISINASPQTVWEVLTQPALVKLWQYGSDHVTDWQPGGDIRFTTAWEDKIFEQWGKVLEITPYEKLSYSLFAPRPGIEESQENYFIMNYLLSEDNGVTKLAIHQVDDRAGRCAGG